MSRIQRTNNRSVLIGDPDLKRFARLQEILKRELGWEAQCVGNFDELAKLAADLNQWRFIVVADTLPLSSMRPNVVLRLYFMNLALGWDNRVGCIVTSDRDPDLTGVQNKPLYLHLKSLANSNAVSAAGTEEIAGYFRRLDKDWLYKRSPRSLEERRRRKTTTHSPASQPEHEEDIVQLDLKAALAEIEHLNASITDDRQEIEKLQREKEKNMAALDHLLERL